MSLSADIAARDPGTLSLAERVALQPAAQRKELLAGLDDETAELLLHDWRFWRRPSQAPPPGEWIGWILCTGRGFGKTRAAAEFVLDEIRDGRSQRSGFIARTAADIRDVLVQGESGILSIVPRDWRPVWESSKRRLTWPNGAVTHTYSAEEPDVLRGPQHDLLWCDELASWKYRETFDNAMLGLRLGTAPRWVAATTPKSTSFMRELLRDATPADQYMKAPRPGAIVLTQGTTYENFANLAAPFITQIVRRYERSRLAKQELRGELLEDSPDALWSRALLERGRVVQHPGLRQVIVAVDPQASMAQDGAETGIVVAGVGEDGHAYVLEDCSLRALPDKWAAASVAAFHRHRADRVVGEANNGGDMVISTIQSADRLVPAKKIIASRGKFTRAEPIATLYAQGLVHHVGFYAELEDQLCTWTPGEKSPDRLDALVWAISELMVDLKAKRYGVDFGIA